jgi:hypothetical protein
MRAEPPRFLYYDIADHCRLQIVNRKFLSLQCFLVELAKLVCALVLLKLAKQTISFGTRTARCHWILDAAILSLVCSLSLQKEVIADSKISVYSKFLEFSSVFACVLGAGYLSAADFFITFIS